MARDLVHNVKVGNYAGVQSGYDPRMLDPCQIMLRGGPHDQKRVGYAECTEAELKPRGPDELARAKFVREMWERRVRH